jgi:hypothetical protein
MGVWVGEYLALRCVPSFVSVVSVSGESQSYARWEFGSANIGAPRVASFRGHLSFHAGFARRRSKIDNENDHENDNSDRLLQASCGSG